VAWRDCPPPANPWQELSSAAATRPERPGIAGRLCGFPDFFGDPTGNTSIESARLKESA